MQIFALKQKPSHCPKQTPTLEMCFFPRVPWFSLFSNVFKHPKVPKSKRSAKLWGSRQNGSNFTHRLLQASLSFELCLELWAVPSVGFLLFFFFQQKNRSSEDFHEVEETNQTNNCCKTTKQFHQKPILKSIQSTSLEIHPKRPSSPKPSTPWSQTCRWSMNFRFRSLFFCDCLGQEAKTEVEDAHRSGQGKGHPPYPSWQSDTATS